MKRHLSMIALAMACAIWIAYAVDQQPKQTDYFQRIAGVK